MEQTNLQEKYKKLVDAANSANINDLHIREQANVLYIDGETPSGEVKDNLWGIYKEIDPEFRSDDLIMSIKVSANSGMVGKAKVITDDDTALNIRKGPNSHLTVVGVAASESTVSVLSKTNADWWLVHTDEGVEGYAYSKLLEME